MIKITYRHIINKRQRFTARQEIEYAIGGREIPTDLPDAIAGAYICNGGGQRIFQQCVQIGWQNCCRWSAENNRSCRIAERCLDGVLVC